MQKYPHVAIMALAILFPLALTGCSDDKEESTSVTKDDVREIEGVLNDGSYLSWELTQAEGRVAQQCMEDKGFAVHDKSMLQGMTSPHRFDGFASPFNRLPDVETAEIYGFGGWLQYADLLGMDEATMMEYSETNFGSVDQGFDDYVPGEYEAFEAEGEEYNRSYRLAFYGEEQFERNEAMRDMGPEEESPEPVPFGGCELETIRLVYGEPEYAETEWGGYWKKSESLESPLVWIGDGTIWEYVSEEMSEEIATFSECAHDGGIEKQEIFDDMGWAQFTIDYYDRYDEEVEKAYPIEDQQAGKSWSDIDTSGLEVVRDEEIAEAVIVATCAEESDLVRIGDDLWEDRSVSLIIDRKTEIYAWQEQIQSYLNNAQEALEA